MLLEVPVLLESVGLGHRAALFVGLDVASLAPEVLQFAAEDLIFLQLAVERTVVEGYLEAGLEADAVEELFVIADNPGLAADKLVLEPLADHLVEQRQRRVGLEAHAVRRIDDHERGSGGLLEVAEILALHDAVLVQSGLDDVGAGRCHGGRIDIAGVDVVVKGTLSPFGLLTDALKEVGAVVLPLLKGEHLAEFPRSDALGDESGLDGDGARAAHGVDKVRVALPARELDDAGGQHLVHRRLDGRHAVAALVQAVARGVEREGAVVVGDMDVETYVGISHGDVGALADGLTEVVDNGVLHLVGDKLGVAEVFRVDNGVDGECGVGVQDVAPLVMPHGLVDLVGRSGGEVLERLENPYGGAQEVVGAVHHGRIAGEIDYAASFLYIFCADSGELIGQDAFQSLKGFGYQFEFLFH